MFVLQVAPQVSHRAEIHDKAEPVAGERLVIQHVNVDIYRSAQYLWGRGRSLWLPLAALRHVSTVPPSLYTDLPAQSSKSFGLYGASLPPERGLP